MISNEEKYGAPTPKCFDTPEYRRMAKAPEPRPAERASEYITISVAEYHFLTKAATLLEAILNADKWNPAPVVTAARSTIEEMKRTAEAGADQ